MLHVRARIGGAHLERECAIHRLVAVVGGIAILGEPVTLAMVGGGGMVIAGVVLAQQLKKRVS